MEHRVEIPQQVIEEQTPTRECLNLAQELVLGYAQMYPEEYWPLVMCEEPLVKPLKKYLRACGTVAKDGTSHACIKCYEDNYTLQSLDLLAKIDSYFYVPEDTQVESGIPGYYLTLTAGWWIHEYKTKTPYIPIGIYMQSWEVGMQASYQMLALQYHLDSPKSLVEIERLGWPDTPPRKVQGVLVNVLEKPIRHIPKRKCRTCVEAYEFATWVPTGTGMYSCPVCGVRQVLQPLKENPVTTPPAYYRIGVTRTAEELARHECEIIQVGEQMLDMEAGGLHSFPWRHEACVDLKWKRACDYYSNHRLGVSTEDDEQFETPPDYRGLVTIGDSIE